MPGQGARWPDVSDGARKSMRANRGKDTGPELAVRRLVHAMGYRYRLHRAGLPGRPDLVFGPRRKAVFVHGCFWHSHPGCPAATVPKTRAEYWVPKLARNRERDADAARRLNEQGWTVLTVWECWLRDETRVAALLRGFLEGGDGAHLL